MHADPIGKPQQQRALATRAQIVEGAARAFVKHGYAASTLSAIGKETKISNGALYFHFPTREAVAVAVLDQYQAAVRDIVERHTNPDTPALATVITVSFAFARAIASDVIVQAGIVLSTERSSIPESASRAAYQSWAKQVAGAMRIAQRQGDIGPDIDIDELSTFLIATFTGVQLTSAMTSKRRDLIDRVRAGWEFLLPALVPPERLGDVTALVEASAAARR